MSHVPFKTGVVVLVAGTATVSDTKILLTSTVLITNEGLSGTVGLQSVALSPGSGFTVNSANVLDTSTIKYLLIY